MVNRWEGLSEPFPGLFASSLSLHNNHVGHWHWDLEEEVACPTSEPTISAVTYIQVVSNACFFLPLWLFRGLRFGPLSAEHKRL